MQIQPPQLTIKQQKTEWINMLVHIHDLYCKCNDPLEHTVDLIAEKEKNLRFQHFTKLNLQKCLTGGEENTTHQGGEEDAFDAGDLEKLFDEDFPEEETG